MVYRRTPIAARPSRSASYNLQSYPGQFAEQLIVPIADAARPLTQLRAVRAAQQHLTLGEDQLDQIVVAEPGRAQPGLHDLRQVLALHGEGTGHNTSSTEG